MKDIFLAARLALILVIYYECANAFSATLGTAKVIEYNFLLLVSVTAARDWQ
jgi:hypothetical protein